MLKFRFRPLKGPRLRKWFRTPESVSSPEVHSGDVFSSAVGVAGSASGYKGALGTSSGVVGASGSGVGAENEIYSAAGAVGAAGSTSAQRQAQGSAVSASGISSALTSTRSTAGTSVGAAGLSGSSSGGPIQVATGFAVGTESLTGSALGATGPARLEGSGGPRKRKGKPFFVHEHIGSAVGAVGLSGAVRGVKALSVTAPVEEEQLAQQQLQAAHTAATLAAYVHYYSIKGKDKAPVITGSARGIALSVVGRVTGTAQQAEQEQQPPARPAPVAPPTPSATPAPPSPRVPEVTSEPVVAAGFARGTLSLVGSARGVATWEQEDDDEFGLVLALAIADADEEAA